MNVTHSIKNPVDLDFADFERQVVDYNGSNRQIDGLNTQASSTTMLTEDTDTDGDGLFGGSPPGSPAITFTEADKDLANTSAWFQSAEQEQFRPLNASTNENIVALTPPDDTQSLPSPTIDLSDRPETPQPPTGHSNTQAGNRSRNEASQRQSHTSIPQAQQRLRQRPGRAPFRDVRQAREWLLDPKTGQAEAAIKRDETIPHGLLEEQQKRDAASKLRTAFERAQPVKSDKEFHILDAMCLELVQEITLFHLFGPLTTLYTSGQSKFGTASFKAFGDHVDTIAQVLGTQSCPKAKSVRKRLTDAPYRKRLIDNPLDEIGLVKKNKDVNEARRLRMEETKAKAARAVELERELTQLKSQITIRPRAKHSLAAVGSEVDITDDNTWAQQPVKPWKIAKPSRQSSKLSGREGNFIMQALHSYLEAPISAPGHFSQDFGTSFCQAAPESETASPLHPTLTDTHGPSAPKKSRYREYNAMTAPSTPTPIRRRMIIAASGLHQQAQSAHDATDISQGHYRWQVSTLAASTKPGAPLGVSEAPKEYRHIHSAQHRRQRQESWMWFQTGQITQQAHQENMMHLDHIDTAAAESGLTSSKYPAQTESSLLATTTTSGTDSFDLRDLPNIESVTAEEIAQLFDLQG